MASRKRPQVVDRRQTSFVVAKADVEHELDRERELLVAKRRQAWREGRAATAERCEGALEALSAIRDWLGRLS